ncbi:MAG: winged helix-turn-helix transcriptional regulator, partial [Chloroflexota bacterium]
DIKPHEYALLDELAHDPLATQANLSSRLGIAVGSVNWYIKRLVNRGWVKVSHLSRTRLQYDLTPEGMAVFAERALQYAKDSLGVYKAFRQKARRVAAQLQAEGIESVYLDGGDEDIMDILRLTCLEAGLSLAPAPGAILLRQAGQEYEIERRGRS